MIDDIFKIRNKMENVKKERIYLLIIRLSCHEIKINDLNVDNLCQTLIAVVTMKARGQDNGTTREGNSLNSVTVSLQVICKPNMQSRKAIFLKFKRNNK